MNKYCFAMISLINSSSDGDREDISIESAVEDIFNDDFDECAWFRFIYHLEMLYSIEIPGELVGDFTLTIRDFAEKLATLPILPDAVYPEFLKIETTSLKDIIRLTLLEQGLEDGTAEEQEMLNKRIDDCQRRLAEIAGRGVSKERCR